MTYTGDNWTLHVGDCREVMAGMPDGAADCVLTDPPYAISRQGMSQERLPGKGSRNLDFFPGDSDWMETRDGLVLPALRESIRVLKPAGSAYWWCSHRLLSHISDELETAGFKTRVIVWRKTCPPPPAPGAGWGSAVELCVYAYKPGRTWAGGLGRQDNVIDSDSYRFGQPGKVDHPTQKPLACFSRFVRLSTNPGDLVLDPFAGSGTSGVVALSAGRRFVGIELDPGYAQIAASRLSDAAGQLDLFGLEASR